MPQTPTRASSGTITRIVWVSYWTSWNLIHERVRSGRSAHSLVYLMDMVVQTALISCETTCISLLSRSHHFHRTLNKLFDEASLQLSKPSCSQLETSQVALTKVAHVLFHLGGVYSQVSPRLHRRLRGHGLSFGGVRYIRNSSGMKSFSISNIWQHIWSWHAFQLVIYITNFGLVMTKAAICRIDPQTRTIKYIIILGT